MYNKYFKYNNIIGFLFFGDTTNCHTINCPLSIVVYSDILNDVCLDYMHIFSTGIIKCLITFWVKGKKDIRLTE